MSREQTTDREALAVGLVEELANMVGLLEQCRKVQPDLAPQCDELEDTARSIARIAMRTLDPPRPGKPPVVAQLVIGARDR